MENTTEQPQPVQPAKPTGPDLSQFVTRDELADGLIHVLERAAEACRRGSGLAGQDHLLRVAREIDRKRKAGK